MDEADIRLSFDLCQKVLVQNPISKSWDEKGTITGIRSLGRSYDVLMDSGKTFLRNRSFLRPIHQTRTEDNSVPTATPSDDQKPTKPRRSARLSNKKN